MVDIVKGDGRLFLNVMFWAAVVLFTIWLPKVNTVVDNATGISPVPVRFAVRGLFAVLSLTDKVPTRLPDMVGVKVTLITQLAAGPNDAGAIGHVLVCR